MDGPDQTTYRIGLRFNPDDASKIKRQRRLVLDPDDARILDYAYDSATTGEPLVVHAAATYEVYKMAKDFVTRFGLTEPTVEDLNQTP